MIAILGLLTLGILSVGILLFYPVFNRGTPADCKNELLGNIEVIVRNDYLATLPRYTQHLNMLGTATPELSFESVKIDSGAYFIPFTAKGPKTTIQYFGMVDCKSLRVEYGSDK